MMTNDEIDLAAYHIVAWVRANGGLSTDDIIEEFARRYPCASLEDEGKVADASYAMMAATKH